MVVNGAGSGLRAALYCRISRDDEALRQGVKTQERDCRTLCEQEGWPLATVPGVLAERDSIKSYASGVFIDNDISAAQPGKRRPAYEAMVKAIRLGQADVVVVSVVDRLQRQPGELESFVEVCNTAGMHKVIPVKAPPIDLTDPDALYTLREQVNRAAWEIGRMRQRQRRKQLQLAEEGKFHGGVRPFGYEKDGVTIRESEAVLIREAAQRVIHGDSLRAIAGDWDRRGISTVRGRPWRITSLRDILRSPRNTGLRQHHDRTNTVEAEWPAIIDRETWKQLQVILDNPARKPRPVRRDYILRGLLRCSECGHYLGGAPQGRPTESDPNRILRYYRCRKDDGGCSKTFVRAKFAEAAVIPAVLALVDNPHVRALSQEQEQSEHEYIRTLVAENAEDEARLRELEDAFAAGDLSRAGLQRNGRTIRERIEARKIELAALQGSTALSRFPGHVKEHWEEFDMDERRTILASMLDHVDVKPSGGHRTFNADQFDLRWRLAAVGNLALDLHNAGQFAAAAKAWFVAAAEHERRMTPEDRQRRAEREAEIMAEYERRAGLKPGEGLAASIREAEEYQHWQEEPADNDRPVLTVVPSSDQDSNQDDGER
jgi:DNA invertase Pin-like site-specific DNA recombinase